MPSDSATYIIDPPTAAPVGDGPPRVVAGYPLGEALGPCPGGTAFRAVHPSLRTPLEFRLFDADFVADVPAFVRQMQDACPATHPHLAALLDAGSAEDQPFAVLEAFAGADLESLVRDIGPMPVAIASTYTRHAALGLDAAHARGLSHGAVRASAVRVGPLVPSSSRTKPDGSPLLRPGPTATGKVYELGLVPRSATPADDVAALGSMLYFLLTGIDRGPNAPSLAQRRPDVPGELVELIATLTAPNPPSMAEAAERLASFVPPIDDAPPPPEDASTSRSSILPAEPRPIELVSTAAEKPVELTPAQVPMRTKSGGWVVTEYVGPEPEQVPVFAVEASGSSSKLDRPSSSDGLKFTSPTADRPAGATGRRKLSPAEQALQTRRWLLAGLAFWLMAALLWFVIAFQRGCFHDAPEPTPAKKGKK